MDTVIRQRIRGLRLARGWSLDTLAARCFLSPSTLSRIETGHRRIALDQLVPIARALGTTLDQLVESVADEDVVIRPQPEHMRGQTVWLLSSERMPARRDRGEDADHRRAVDPRRPTRRAPRP